jgi:hypothetical protein
MCLLGIAISLASSCAWAQTPSVALEHKAAFITDLMNRMTLDEKVGQLRLISIASDMPRELIRTEIAPHQHCVRHAARVDSHGNCASSALRQTCRES